MANFIEFEGLELVEVEEIERGFGLTFLNEEAGEVLEVNLSTKDYNQDTKKWVTNEEKEAKTEEFIKEHFGVDSSQLAEKIGEKYTVYSYPSRGFNSLQKFDMADKFEVDQSGELINTVIDNVRDDGKIIHIEYLDADGVKRESKMSYSKFNEKLNKMLVDPIKKAKVYEKFEKKYGVAVADADKITGLPIVVIVKVAFNKYAYGDIQDIPKKALDAFLNGKK